ncbi:MAG: hypothetical protein CM1200mP18_17700 [Gammaproteobacteria bacterium]|nr:MAG: hypothetical protein CM1200mP18_17700 [Gammaproteobacteria bacterium]
MWQDRVLGETEDGFGFVLKGRIERYRLSVDYYPRHTEGFLGSTPEIRHNFLDGTAPARY